MSTRPRTHLAKRLAAVILAPLVGFAGAVVTDLAVAVPAQAASYGATISRSEALSRARDWYGRRGDSDMTYTQKGTTTDPEGGHRYRRDCSGYVNMAWHMSSGPNTEGLVASSLTTEISRSQLQPGDALIDTVDNDSGYPFHAIIFQGWNDAAKTRFQYYSFGSTPIDHVSNASFSDSTLSGHATSQYKAYRYKKMADTTPGVGVVQHGAVTRVFGRGTDGALWQYWLEGGTWHSQEVGGQIIGSPAAVWDAAAGLLRVFAQGADHALWQYYWDGSTWRTQEIGGTLTSGVGATMHGNTVRVFFRGGDGSLWQYWLAGGSWSAQEIGGYMLDNPAVVYDTGAALLRVFFQGTDGAMWQAYWDSDNWRTQRIGGEFTAGFGATYTGGVVRVFGRGSGPGALYQYYLANGTWSLQPLGGTITSGTATVHDGTYLRAFARGADGALWQNSWNGSAWTWDEIGGQLA